MRSNSSSILTHPFLLLLYYLTIFAIPYFRWRSLSAQYPFLKIDWLLVMGIAIILIPYYLLQKRFPENLGSNLWPWLLLFFVINLISTCYSPYPAAALDGLRLLILCYMFIGLNLMFISEKGFCKILPHVLFWSVSIGAFLATIGYFFLIPMFYVGLGKELRGAGPTIGANNLALMSIFILPLLVHWVFYGENPLSRFFAFILISVNLLGIVSSFSRGGFLNVVLISMLILFEQRHRFNARHLGIILVPVGIFPPDRGHVHTRGLC